MKPTLIVLAFAVACGTAMAADNPAPAVADECTSLQAKYDAADKSQVPPNKLRSAKTQRTKGGDLCERGNKTEGVKALKAALAGIGVKE